MRGTRFVSALGASATFILILACGGFGSRDEVREPVGPQNVAPPPGESRFVTPAGGAVLRAGPSVDTDQLVLMPARSPVVVTGPSQGGETHTGVTGGWAPVWFAGLEGWVFDPFVLPHPAPPEGCESLEAWAAAIGHAGNPSLVGTRSCAEFQILVDGDCERTFRTPLNGGAWFERMEGYEWGQQTLYLPGVPRDALWAAARTCIPAPPDFRGRALPSKSGPIDFQLEYGGQGEAQVEADRAGWDWEEEGYAWLHVHTIGADAKVAYGGGL